MIFNSVIVGAGGGGPTSVDAKAVGSVITAEVDDKVILIPSGVIYSSGLISGNTTFTKTVDYGPTINGPLGQLDFDIVKAYEGFLRQDSGNYITGTWNDALSDFASVSSTSFTAYNVNYRAPVPVAVYTPISGNYYGQQLETFGIFKNGAYTPLVTWSDDRGCIAHVFDYVNGHFICGPSDFYGWSSVGSVSEDSFQAIQIPRDRFGIMLKDPANDAWYYTYNGSDFGSNIMFNMDGTSSGKSLKIEWSVYTHSAGVYYIDDETDYIFVLDYGRTNPGFFKIDKSTSSWTCTKLIQPTSAISSAIQGGLASRNNRDNWDSSKCFSMIAYDRGDYVEIIIGTSEFGYDANGDGNKIAHMKFDKTSETIERLPDIFADVPTDLVAFDTTTGFNCNWPLGLVSCCLLNSDSSSKTNGLFVKKLDGMAGIYKYFAFSPDKGNYYADQSITGFVKENKGVNELGDTVLSVNTTEDPDYIWTPPEGVVLGMNVIVNEGEPA